jgi:hypothetical protein
MSAGVCAVDITPISPGLVDEYEAAFGGTAVVNHTDPVYMAGFGNDRQATGYNDQLWARGVVVDGADGRVAIVSVDLVGYFNAEVETIRSLVDPAAGIDYVVVSSTHQHKGPDTVGIWGPDATTSGIDFGYLDFVNQSVADCINQAAATRQPARIKFATTDGAGLSLGIDLEDDGFGVADSRVLVDGSVYWLALLQNASPEQLPAAIRAAGAHPGEQVNAFLAELLVDPNSKTEIAAEAGMALGASQDVAMVEPVADALMKEEPRLSNAAIRALGQIGGPEARDALEHAARTHPDPATRRRATAKLRSGDALSARSDPP